MIPWLGAEPGFPPDERALREPNGLLAAGGDLSPAWLLAAYRRGIFPWFSEGEPILWWTPDPRLVLVPDEFHVSHSLRKTLRRRRFEVRTDTAFADVLRDNAQMQNSLGAGTPDWFEVIAAGSMVPRKKPAPDIYFHAMEYMGVGPAECLAFEDSENGLIAARAAGLKTLVTVSDYTQGHDFSGAALLLDQLGEPGHPFRVLAGEVNGAEYVNVDLLRRLHVH